MHEAREGIIDRLARDLPTNIDLERFLNVVVSEIGRMMDADRCDLLQLTEGNELRISHEWRKDESVPPSEGTTIPFDAQKLTEKFDLSQPIRINDTTKTKDATVKFFTKALETQSLAGRADYFERKSHRTFRVCTTRTRRANGSTRKSLFSNRSLASLPSVINIRGFMSRRNRKRKRTNALLEIANTLNSHSDFNEVSARVLERAVELVGADYGALGVLDQTGKKISLGFV